MLPKVSIIVPIHNAGKYLEKCLLSLVNQTLRDIEIILVLDCPTDGSDKIAEQFAAADSRIKLISNEVNLHTGYSRNRGIDIAKGEYIGFHDHDDYSEPQMYEMLYNAAKAEDETVVRCNFTCVYEDKTEPYVYPSQSDSLRSKTWMYQAVGGDKISCVLWNHIYKTDFLKQHDIRFLDSRTICSEDSIFFLRVYQNIDDVGVVDDYLYHHVFHTNNTGKNYSYRSIRNRIGFFEEIYNQMRRSGLEDVTAVSYVYEYLIRSLYTATRQAFLSLSFFKANKELKQVLDSHLVEKCIEYLYAEEDRTALKKMKPTVILFSFYLKKVLFKL